jgi:hypothetical protein
MPGCSKPTALFGLNHKAAINTAVRTYAKIEVSRSSVIINKMAGCVHPLKRMAGGNSGPGRGYGSPKSSPTVNSKKAFAGPLSTSQDGRDGKMHFLLRRAYHGYARLVPWTRCVSRSTNAALSVTAVKTARLHVFYSSVDDASACINKDTNPIANTLKDSLFKAKPRVSPFAP